MMKKIKEKIEEELPMITQLAGGKVATFIVETIYEQPKDWQPLSEWTILAKGDASMLVDTGAMKRSILPAKVTVAGKVASVNAGIFREGSSPNPLTGQHPLEYAATHEFGTWIEKGGFLFKIPERSFLRKTMDEKEDKIVDVLADLIEDAIDSAFH